MSQTVLICDDTAFMRGVISRAMTEAGFEIAGEAKTGLEAVEQYRQTQPDVVTMDIVMPDMSGIDAVREIVEMDPSACIVMCSAMGPSDTFRGPSFLFAQNSRDCLIPHSSGFLSPHRPTNLRSSVEVHSVEDLSSKSG